MRLNREDLVVSRETSPRTRPHTPAVVPLTRDGSGTGSGVRGWGTGDSASAPWWGGRGATDLVGAAANTGVGWLVRAGLGAGE